MTISMSSKRGRNNDTTHELTGENESRFRSFFENCSDAMFIGSPEGQIFAANPAAQSMFGMTEDELKAAGRDGITIKDERLERAIQERKDRGKVTAELMYRRKDGTTFLGEITSSEFVEGDGTPSITVLIRDISERKRAEAALNKANETLEKRVEEQFRRALEDAPIPTIMQAEDGEVLQISKTWTELTGYTIKDIRSFDEWVTKAVYGEGANEVRDHLHELFKEDKRSIDAEFKVRAITGEARCWSFSASCPGTLMDGRRFIVGMAVDITESKRARKALMEANETLEAKVKERTNDLARSNAELQHFAYVASHDLQEPLRMVTSYLGLLEKRYGSELNPQAKEYMSFAVDGSLRMKELIDDLLDFSRIDSKPIDLEEVDMNKVAGMVEVDLRLAIEEVGAEIIIGPLPKVRADEVQMKQLLTNLVSNAIKFHDGRPPRVEVSAITFNNEFVFSVQDNGIGIDPKYADRLFNMFSRLHTKDEYPGTGIGLAICKRIVERHGGKIWFESEPGKGTTFYFTIPS
jgi:PAS domain S-box-containing protein